MKVEVILCISVIVITLIATNVLYFYSLPGYAVDQDDSMEEKEYLQNIYGENNTVNIDKDNLNFLWNNLPDDYRHHFPVAYNLSFKWPPQKGERAKLTAFPYPKGGKKGWFLNFIEGMASLLNNTADQATFPGWLVSIYDQNDPNNNEYAKWLTKNLPWNADTGPVNQNNGVYIEVTHACYPPPDYEYPTCDDGGYWLYLTPGSGVFWNTGNKCLVASNKIDAMLKMLNTTIGKAWLQKQGYKDSLDYLTQTLKNTGGGMSLINAMQKVIDAMQDKTQIPTITAFRNMEPATTFSTWYGWIFYTSFMVILLLTLVIYSFVCLRRSFKGQQKWWLTILVLLLTGSITIGMYYLWFNVVSDKMLTNFGYMTLDMALSKSKLSLSEFISASVDGKNLLANSLAMIQNYDFHLEELASALGLSSIIFHTQPNKSGSWAIEIIDVRNTPFKVDAKSPKDLIYKLGICGNPMDGSKSNMPPLMQGPLTTSDLYFGYQPTATCDCDEENVKQTYDKNGKLKLCVFCKNMMSDKMC